MADTHPKEFYSMSGRNQVRLETTSASLPNNSSLRFIGRGNCIKFTNGENVGALDPTQSPPYRIGYAIRGALRSYACAEKRIREEHPRARNARGHATYPLKAPFYSAQSTPIPASTNRAITVISSSAPTAGHAFWGETSYAPAKHR